MRTAPQAPLSARISLGHAHPGTTRRYAMHSPEQFQDADTDRVASHMGLTMPAAIFSGEGSRNLSAQRWIHAVLPSTELHVYSKAE
jgi:hypothetical protein